MNCCLCRIIHSRLVKAFTLVPAGFCPFSGKTGQRRMITINVRAIHPAGFPEIRILVMRDIFSTQGNHPIQSP